MFKFLLSTEEHETEWLKRVGSPARLELNREGGEAQMSPIRREVFNGLFVLILSTLLSAAIGAFGLKFNLLVWVLIIMAAAISVVEQNQRSRLKRTAPPCL